MNRLQRIPQVLVVLLSFGFLSVNTLAQSAKTLEEVIITAQKKEESLLDSAIDVSVFSGEDLQKYSKYWCLGTDLSQGSRYPCIASGFGYRGCSLRR